MIDPADGAVAFVSPQRVSVPDALQVATERVRTILEGHLMDVPPGPHPRGRHDPFEAILARSPFPHVEKIEHVYQVRVRPTLASLVGAEYSMSHVLARLGNRRERFEDDIRAALPDLEDIGEITLTRRDVALIGRR